MEWTEKVNWWALVMIYEDVCEDPGHDQMHEYSIAAGHFSSVVGVCFSQVETSGMRLVSLSLNAYNG